MVERVMTVAKHLFPDVTTIADIASPVGVGHAYDLTHLLARAIELAETTERTAIRDALEKVKNYRGLVKFYRHPFSPNDHDALGANDVFMATYRADGAIVPLRHQ
jgi:branched-chain amino acid transport system substrate-binding protein